MRPLTRKEIFENAIAQGKEAPIEPVTREEMILAAHAKREASGGSGGGGGVEQPKYILVSEEDPDSGNLVVRKEESVLPTFAALMEYFNNRQIFRLTVVHTSSYDGTTIVEGSRLKHVTEFNGNDCNAMLVGSGEWTAYVTDDNEILTEGEMNEKYPDTRE